ncbi:MAG: tetratricopeptide repeat protein [Microcoleus anatoxicus]|uniref:tetratricopeptide repeat protein n=1 Tax=Microcoleus anatoxicus TaxID=2705319 RepID=UPI0036705DF2
MSIEEYIGQAQVYLNRGKLSEAMDCCKKAIELQPFSPSAYTTLGEILEAQGDPTAARDAFVQALEISPGFFLAHAYLGQLYSEYWWLDEAVFHYRQALDLKPDWPELYYNLGNVVHKQGNLLGAIDCYQQAIALKPNYVLAFYNLAVVLAENNQLEAAIDSYRQVIALQPDYIDAYNNLGCTLVKHDRFPEAREIYQAGLAIQPDSASLYNNLGQVLLDKNPDGAIAAYQRAIELEPDLVLAHYNLGKAWQIQGEHSAAVACFDRVVELNPDYISGYTDAGFSLMALGKITQALAYFAQAIAVKPDFVEAYCDLAQREQFARDDDDDDEYSKAIAACGRFLQALIGRKEKGRSHPPLPPPRGEGRTPPYPPQGGKEELPPASPKEGRKSEVNPPLPPPRGEGRTPPYPPQGGKEELPPASPKEGRKSEVNPPLPPPRGEGRTPPYPPQGGKEELPPASPKEGRKSEVNPPLPPPRGEGRTPPYPPQGGKEELPPASPKEGRKSEVNPPLPPPRGEKKEKEAILNAQFSMGEICDNLAEIYIHLGNTLAQYGGHESATTYYQKALQIQPQNTELYWLLGNSLVKQKRLNAAIFLYHRALAIQPALPQVYFELAKVLQKQGHWERAIDYYQKVLELQSYGYSQPQLSPQGDSIAVDSMAMELPQGIYLSTWDWLVNARLDAGNYVEIVWKYAAEARAENTANSQFPIANASATLSTSSQLANSDCGGLTCGLCLQRLSKWFDPIHLGWGVCRLSNSQPLPVESPKTFVAAIPNGRSWIVPQENYWLICKAIAVITPDNYLLADVSRDYPGFLPGCEKHDIRKHSVFNLESFPPLKQIEGRVAVLSGLSGNVYFHWMVDVLPRIELLRRSGRDLAEIDWFLVNSCQHQFQRDSLRILGIPEEKVLESDRQPHIQATELIVPSFAGYLGWPSAWAIDFLRGEFLKGIIPSYNYPKRIYISRSKARYRRVLNEADVVEVLAEFGFVSILPESMSLEEQIAYFYHAEVIVAAHGSGLTNTLFCQGGTKVIELMSPHYISHYYWGTSQYLQLEHYFLTGEAFECYPIRQLMYQNSLTEDILVNLSSLKRMVEVVGLG